jgi:PAS domain S-box-containing protein
MKTAALSNRTVQLAFGSAMAILLVAGVLSYRSMAVSNESTRWVEHSREVLRNLHLIRYSMESVTSSIRGFVLTGKESYLDDYRSGLAAAVQYRDAARDLTVDNPGQQLRLSTLDKLISERAASAQMLVDLRLTQGMEAAAEAVRTGPGLRITDEFQTIIVQMQGEEYRLLDLRRADAAQRLGQTRFILVAGLLLGLLTTGAAGWSVQRDNSKRGLAEEALKESERKYRTLIDGVKDYAILMLGPLGEIRSWNPGAERMSGCTFEEVAGQNFSRFFPAEDVAQGKPQEMLRTAAANGEHEEQGARLRKDGTRYPARTAY